MSTGMDITLQVAVPTPRTDKLKIPSEALLLIGQKGVPEKIVQAILMLGDHARQLETELALAVQALKIIVCTSQCADGLMGDKDVARAALTKLSAGERT